MTITGHKHTCSNCEARFFDLGKSPATCPKCETVQIVPKTKGRAAVKIPVEPEIEKAKKPYSEDKSDNTDGEDGEDEENLIVEEDVDLDVDLDDDDDEDDDDSLMEDTSDLGDDDDVSGVIEYVPNSDSSES